MPSQSIGGNGLSSTAALTAYLNGHNELWLANLILIGQPENPESLWLTDWESPLLWPCYPGTFNPAVIKRGTVSNKIGLTVDTLKLTWTPKTKPYSVQTQTANAYQLVQMGYYDNWPVRVWTAFMPSPGDVNTFGAAPLFGGYIGDSTTQRGAIEFTVNSFLAVAGQQVPTNVIELLNTAAAYSGAKPPPGFDVIPQLNVIAGSSTNVIIGDCTNIGPGQIFDDNALQGGFLVFNKGPNSTLGGLWSAIQQNTKVTVAGTDYNQFVVYTPFNWPPTEPNDTFYISAPAPINQTDGDYFGFPYIPAPLSAAAFLIGLLLLHVMYSFASFGNITA